MLIGLNCCGFARARVFMRHRALANQAMCFSLKGAAQESGQIVCIYD